MPRFTRRVSAKTGLPPGTPVHLGDHETAPVKITAFHYNEMSFEEVTLEEAEQVAQYQNRAGVTWINVNGIHEVDKIQTIGKLFGLHPLVLEDITNAGQRPKIEDYGEYVFVVTKMVYLDEQKQDVVAEQVSLVLSAGYVITFQEREGDVFAFVRDRIRSAKGQIRKMAGDYLLYSLIDAIVDHSFAVLEGLEEIIQSLETPLMEDPQPENLALIHTARTNIIFVRRSVWSVREVLAKIDRQDLPHFAPSTRVYFRDVYDHAIQVVEIVDTLRDIISGMTELYLSSVSNRMNGTMKILTVIATIFIPLTFIAGVYGMNFTNMPELAWRWGYFAALGLMGAIGVLMVVFFKRKKWL